MLALVPRKCRPFRLDVVDDCALACMAATTTSANGIISLSISHFSHDENMYEFLLYYKWFSFQNFGILIDFIKIYEFNISNDIFKHALMLEIMSLSHLTSVTSLVYLGSVFIKNK